MINIFENKKRFLVQFLTVFISGLFFSFNFVLANGGGGGGGNCFVAGTEITMSDNTTKKIEDVKIGDQVKTVNPETMKVEDNLVEEISSPIHSDLVRLTFESGENKNTFDHPYYVKGKGFSSYNPDLTQQRYGFSVASLAVGDTVYRLDDENELIEEKLLKITEEIKEVQTYNLNKVANNHNFFAGGFLVHNKTGVGGDGNACGNGACFVAGTEIVMSDDTTKKIEDVEIGDQVKTVNMKTMKIENNLIEKIVSPIHSDIIRLTFENGENKNTFDHPYYVKGKGYASYKPDLTQQRYGFGVASLEVGDIVYRLNDENELVEEKLSSITEEIGEVQTYNLHKVSNNHNFFAGGILVHNKDDGSGGGASCTSAVSAWSACSATVCDTKGTQSRTVTRCSWGGKEGDICSCNSANETKDCSAPACVCVPNCNCAASTNIGSNCLNSCRTGWCAGTKPIACVPNCNCAASTNIGSNCLNSCGTGWCAGTKCVPNCNCAATTNVGSNCLNSCGTGWCAGTKCVPNCNAKFSYCSGVSFNDSCGGANACVGAKTCPSAFPGSTSLACSSTATNILTKNTPWTSYSCSSGSCNSFTYNVSVIIYCGTEKCLESTDMREYCNNGDVWEQHWGKDDSCSTSSGCDSNSYYGCGGVEKKVCEVGYTCKVTDTSNHIAECVPKSATWTEE